jgi:PKD repeat protein
MLRYFIHLSVCLTLTLIGAFVATAQTLPTDFVHEGSINSGLNAPSRMAISSTGFVYVADSYAKLIKKYDASGNYLGILPFAGVPLSIAISDNNNIFIGDADNSSITRLAPDGSVSVIYSALIFPFDMVIGTDNLLYVVDGISKKVLVMDFAGNIVRTIGSGVLLAPRCIAFDRQNHRIIVTEHGGVGTGTNLHAEIRIFGLTGNLITTFGGYGNALGKFYRIQGITVGRCGNIYVSDNFQGMISVFNSNGSYITRFGQFGDLLGELNSPLDIDFDAQQKLWVSSMNNGALEVFNIADTMPSAQIPNNSATLCPGGSADIPVTFTGTPPFTFTYTVNGLSPTTVSNTYNNPYVITTSVPGSYNINALTDTAATSTCFSGTTNVVLNPAPTASITNTTASICSGSTFNIPVNFTGTKPFSFTYTVDGINPITVNNIYSDSYSIPASTSGTYAITALSGGGCTGTAITGSATVLANNSPHGIMSSLNATLCAGQNINIPVQLSGTAPWSFTYSIDGQNPILVSNIADSNYMLSVSEPGTYEISALSDAICSFGTYSGAAVVTANPIPTASIISNSTTICQGETANIGVSFTGVGPWDLSYTIDGLNTITYTGITTNIFAIPVSQPGTVELTSVSSSGCTGTLTPGNILVSVNTAPTASILTTNISVCSGESALIPVTLTGIGPWNLTYTNHGSSPVVVNNILSSPVILNVSDSGIYEISYVSDALCTGISFSGSTHVTVIPQASASITSGNASICSGQIAYIDVNFTGAQPYSFEYTLDGTNPVTINGIYSNTYTIETTQGGFYQISDLVGNSCGSTNFSGSALINVYPLPIVDLGADTDICEGSSVTLDAGGPFVNYIWNNSSTSQTITVNTGDTYTASVMDGNGCVNHDALIVTSHPAVVGGFSYSINNFNVTFTNTSLNANSWQWNFGDGQNSNLPNPVHLYSASGIYYVNLTASNPYCGFISITDTIDLLFTGISSSEATESNFIVYPNPTNGYVTLEISNPSKNDLELEIMDMTGQLVYSEKFSSYFIRKKIDMSKFAVGIYTIRLSSAKDIKTQKLILVK